MRAARRVDLGAPAGGRTIAKRVLLGVGAPVVGRRWRSPTKSRPGSACSSARRWVYWTPSRSTRGRGDRSSDRPGDQFGNRNRVRRAVGHVPDPAGDPKIGEGLPLAWVLRRCIGTIIIAERNPRLDHDPVRTVAGDVIRPRPPFGIVVHTEPTDVARTKISMDHRAERRLIDHREVRPAESHVIIV